MIAECGFEIAQDRVRRSESLRPKVGASKIFQKKYLLPLSQIPSLSRGGGGLRWGWIPISAKLLCKRSQVAFMPYRVVLKDERRTSNIERPTSNEKTNTQYTTFNSYSCFFSAVLILVTKILINSSVHMSVSSSFPIQRSMLDVRCSMFIFFSSSLAKTT